MQLPLGPHHWWLSSRTLTVSAKISSESGHSAVLCHLLRSCMTNPQMRLVTFREHCGLCQYAKQSRVCMTNYETHTVKIMDPVTVPICC